MDDTRGERCTMADKYEHLAEDEMWELYEYYRDAAKSGPTLQYRNAARIELMNVVNEVVYNGGYYPMPLAPEKVLERVRP